MAKKKSTGESLGGYFRRVFTENPDWLKVKSNDLVKERYEADHLGEEFTSRIRANMSNIKSIMRKQMRKRGPKPGTRMKTAVATGGHDLEGLELAIDSCLSTAREIDPVGLEAVINSLRRARNQLVWKMGEP
jgi:hypothetical protein